MLVLNLYSVDRTWAQAPASQPLGSLQASGEVYLNNLRATGSQTVFPGDAVRTGPDGAAVLTSPGAGVITVAPQSEITFRAAASPATLKQGSVGIRSLQPGGNLGIQFGNTVLYVPSPAIESVATITVAADGGARIECRSGTVGLRNAQGLQLLILNAGYAVAVNGDGKLQKIEPISPLSRAQPGGFSRRGYVVLAVVAGGGAVAAVVLLTHKSNQLVSPSSP